MDTKLTIIDKIRYSPYLKSLLVLTSGTFISQIVPIIFYPIVARIFSTEQFGSASIFVQITTILSVLCSGSYQYAIFVVRKKKEALNLLSFVIAISLFFLLAIGVVFFICRDGISKLLNEPLFHYLFFSPIIGAFAIIIYQSYNEWSVRQKQYGQLSTNKVINSFSVSISELLIGWINNGVAGNGLIVGELIGRCISALSCIFSIIIKQSHLLKFIHIKSFFHIAFKYSSFPKYIMTGKLINTIACSIPFFYLAMVYTKEQVGLFSMANSIIVIPSTVITLAVSDVFRQRANDDYAKTRSCRRILIKTIIPISLISACGFLLLFIIAPSIFSFVLGDKWYQAGIYARYLIPMMATSFVSEVAKPILIIADKKNFDFLWQVLFLLSMLITIVIDYHCNDIYIYLIVLSAVKSVLFLLQLFWCFKFSEARSKI